jgi:tight adherence protein B
MMGALLGLAFGAGLLLMLRGWSPPAKVERKPKVRRLADQLGAAGLDRISPAQLVVACGGLGGFAFLLVFVVSRSFSIALAFGVMAGYVPYALVVRRVRQRQSALRDVWPDVIDNLASGVRAGLSLPEALAQLGDRGPEPTQRAFQRFAADYRVSGRFSQSLDRLKANLADPVGDRIVESLRVARDVGGNDLGRLLRTLSVFLRQDARTRAELETRQGWTVNGARLAVASPWFVLGLLSLRPQAVHAYDSPAGLVVLALGAAMSLGAYRVMIRIGRLPTEERVLR